MNNNATKVIALVLGIMLFAMLHKEGFTIKSPPSLIEEKWITDVQVHIVGLDRQQQVLKSISSKKVQMQVRGKRMIVLSSFPENYKITVDLTGYKTGKHEVQLNHELPEGIELVRMKPSRVVVELEDVQMKEFEAQIKTTGVPAKGCKAGLPIVRPSNRVHVTLPTSRMTEVKSIIGMVDINQANQSVITNRVKLVAYHTNGTKIKDAVLTPSIVEVEVPITKPFKTVPLHVNVVGQLESKYAISSLSPSVNEVILYGLQAQLDRIEHFDNVHIDLREFQSVGTYTFRVRLLPTENIEKIEPSEISMELKISNIKKRTLIGVPITLTGDHNRLHTTVIEPGTHKMDMMVMGAADLIDKIKINDIQLIANINNLPPGTHVVHLQVNLPRFIQRVDQGILPVTVVIKNKETPLKKQVTTPAVGSDPPLENESKPENKE